MKDNKKSNSNKGKVAWVVPGPIVEGGGGHNTIFRHANYLADNGYTCDIYVKNDPDRLPKDIYDDITKWYGENKLNIFNDIDKPVRKYDLVIATGWDTAETVKKMQGKNKLYFVQDYEPWFYSMGEQYLEARKTYSFGFKNISIGKWLPVKLKNEFGIKVAPFSFGAELDVYHPINGIKKEKAVCFIYQPNKARRCADWGLKALRIVHEIKPDVKIYLYGSPKTSVNENNVKHLGILNVEECNELYNSCEVGLCLSSSNPSRIPFEMMAAGLPVVDLYLENNLYDFPEDGCLLAEPDPKAIAAAILRLLDDDKLREKLSEGGQKYMKDYPQKRELLEFKQNVDKIMNDEIIGENCYGKKYTKDAVRPIEFKSDVKALEIENIEQRKLDQQIAELNEKLNEAIENSQKIMSDYQLIRESTAFKIGSKITMLPHIIKNKFK